MDPETILIERYGIDMTAPRPLEIPDVGREIFGHWFREFGYRVGAEVGVERGIFSSVLLKAHPKLELFCIDSWQPYDGYIARINGDDLPLKYQEAQERLKGYHVHFYRQFSMDAVKRFKDNSLDFVYIDANHDFPWCFEDIIEWEKKVRPGGMVCGHDYIKMRSGKPSRVRVVESLNFYTRLKPIETWFVLGRNAKIPGEIRDNDRSFMWVKK